MSNRKFTADQLFTGYAMLGAGSVLITDETGIVKDIVMLADAGEGVEKFDGIISPCFINCHCHLELSHLHGGVPRNTGLTEFLLSIVKNRYADEEKISSAMNEAELFMKEKGIVAIGDISNTTHSLPIKKKNNLYYHNFIEALGFADARADESFNTALEVYSKFITEDPAHKTSIVPHSPYSVSDRLFQLINDHEKGHANASY